MKHSTVLRQFSELESILDGCLQFEEAPRKKLTIGDHLLRGRFGATLGNAATARPGERLKAAGESARNSAKNNLGGAAIGAGVGAGVGKLLKKGGKRGALAGAIAGAVGGSIRATHGKKARDIQAKYHQ